MQTVQTILVGLALRPRRSVVGVGARGALDQALWLAAQLSARLRVYVSTFERRAWCGEDDVALEEVYNVARNAGVEVEVERTDERAWVALTRAVQSGRGQLVVVGKRDEPSAEGRRLGSQAVKLLRKCPAPVWCVKPEHDLVHKLVLAATDLAPVGDAAVEAAAFVAEHHHCELHVVHAYQLPARVRPDASTLSEAEFAAQVDAIKAAAQAHIDGVLGRTSFDGESVVHLGAKAPHLAIREAVEHLYPDLLVMGTISGGGEAGFLVGSTAERLLDRVDCSLLTLKPVDFVSPLPPDQG